MKNLMIATVAALFAPHAETGAAEVQELSNRIENDADPKDHNKATDEAAGLDGVDAARTAVAHGIADKVADRLEKEGYAEAAGMVRSFKAPNHSENPVFDLRGLAEMFGAYDDLDNE